MNTKPISPSFCLLLALCLTLPSHSLLAQAPDPLEPNDSTAIPTVVGGTIQVSFANLTIDSATDEDFFRIDPTTNHTLLIAAEFQHGLGDIDMELLSAGGSAIASSTSATDNELISLQVTAFDTYFIRVFGFSGATNTYNLNLTAQTEVTNTNGGTVPGSLYNAIVGAQAISTQIGSNVDITFAGGVNGTINLNQQIPALNTTITLVGPGPGVVTVSGGSLFPVFAPASSGNISISGLTIADGLSVGGVGAGIASLATNLTVNNCVLINNHGAAIAHSGNNLLVSNSTFSNNSNIDGVSSGVGPASDGTGGGGIVCSNTVTITDCRFDNNAAGNGGSAGPTFDGGDGGDGGAITYAGGSAGSNVSIDLCTFDGNTSGNGGTGGDSSSSGPNTPGGHAGNGGNGAAIAIAPSASGLNIPITISNSTFVRNTCGNGGEPGPGSAPAADGDPGSAGRGALSIVPDFVATPLVSNCTFTENFGGLPGEPLSGFGPAINGGASAIFLNPAGFTNLELIHCTIDSNTCPSPANNVVTGAALHAPGPPIFTIENIIASNNIVDPAVTNSPADLAADVVAEGTNLVETHVSGIVTAGSGTLIAATDPVLAPLANYGGPVETMLPMQKSPAIDTAVSSIKTPLFDQRLFTRPYAGNPDIGAVESRSLLVNTLADENDGFANDVSLRDAINAFTAEGAPEEKIEFDPAVFTIGVAHTISLASANGAFVANLANAGLNIDAKANLLPDHSPGITIDANFTSRHLEIDANGIVTIDGLALVNGLTSNFSGGGAIFNEGNLTLNHCHLLDNMTADGEDGPPPGPGNNGVDGSNSPNGGAITNQGNLSVSHPAQRQCWFRRPQRIPVCSGSIPQLLSWG
ncbi:MAG: choice-of-anchor Q domain-containing protein, partial [Verrucomicrobiota bacterium]